MKKQKMNFRMEQSLGAVYTHTNSLVKEARGITLVALVVTIVMLLILAGVSINLVLGKNGIITQAQKAKRETNEAKENGAIPESRFFYDRAENKQFNATDIFTQENLNNKYKAVKQGWLTTYYNPETKVANGKVETATEYLMDTTIWTDYLNTKYADWTIGGPTTEMFIKVYNEYYGEQKTFEDIYGNDKSTSIIKDDLLGSGMNYALGGGIENDSYYCVLVYYKDEECKVDYQYTGYKFSHKYFNVRPVVCLKSSAVLTPSADGNTYTVSIK